MAKYDFNSIKVQLEPNTTLSYCFDAEFQFHKGTIRTNYTHNNEEDNHISIP